MVTDSLTGCCEKDRSKNIDGRQLKASWSEHNVTENWDLGEISSVFNDERAGMSHSNTKVS